MMFHGRAPSRRIAFPFAMMLALSAAMAVHAEQPSDSAQPVQIETDSTATPPDAIGSWIEMNSEAEAGVAGSESKVIRRRPVADRRLSGVKKAESGLSPTGASALLWPLIAVLAMIGILAVLVRKWMAGTHRFGADGVIKLLARQYLSNKQSLCLIRVGRRVVLLGVTPDRITTLSDIDAPEEVAGIVSVAERGSAGSFSAALSGFGRRGARLDDEDAFAAEPEEAILPGRIASTGVGVRDLLDRVRKLSGRKSSAEPT